MVLLKKIKIIFWWKLCVKFLILVEVMVARDFRTNMDVAEPIYGGGGGS